MNWTLEELGWELHSPGDVGVWDGLWRWFLEYAAMHPEVLTGRIRDWYRAAKAVFTSL